MPLLTYKCESCGEFEVLTSFQEVFTCKCGKEARLIIKAPSFVFKVKGFYKTDYKDKK